MALGLSEEAAPPGEARASLPERVDAYEAMVIRDALREHDGDVRATVEALGIPRKTFYDKLRRHDIDQRAYRLRE